MRKLLTILLICLVPTIAYADTTLVSCNFTTGSNTVLSSYTCGTGSSPTFTTESTPDQTCASGTRTMLAIASSGRAGVTADVTDCSSIYSAQPNPGFQEYYIQATVIDAGAVDASDQLSLIGRYTDADNMYYSFTQDDTGGVALAGLSKRVGGSPGVLGFANGFTNGQVMKLEIRDATKKLFRAGVEVISSTDNDLTATGKAGISCGGIGPTTSNDCDPQHLWDDFSVVELDVLSAARRVMIISWLDVLIKQAKAQDRVRDGRWYVSPVVILEGLGMSKADSIIRQLGLDCGTSNVIGSQRVPNEWALSYVKCVDYSALDADPEIIKIYNETDGVDLRLNQLSTSDRNSLRTKVNTRKTRNSTLTNSDTVRKWIEDLGKEINPQFNVDGTYVR